MVDFDESGSESFCLIDDIYLMTLLTQFQGEISFPLDLGCPLDVSVCPVTTKWAMLLIQDRGGALR